MEPRCHWELCCIPSGLLPRVEARDAAELFPQRTFFVAELSWQLHVGDQVEVARRAAVRAFLSFARDADGLALLHAGGNADFESVRFGLAVVRIRALERNGAHRAVHHFVERDEDIAFDITAARRAAAPAELFSAEPLFAEGKPEAACAAEESLEEVTEASAAEVKLVGLRAVGAA